MKSKVTKLFDMKQVAVPAEMRKWRVSIEELDAQLARLAAAHPVETHPEMVENGDSVLCRTQSSDPKWNREAVPFYPGRGMLSAQEDALIGMSLQETKTVDGIEITVLEITRRRPAVLTDELICTEGIEYVETVNQYRTWWREKTEQERKNDAIHRLAYFLHDEIVSYSEYDCDDKELDEMALDIARKQYAAMVNAGIDPTIPEDGVTFLTEEEALAKIAQENRQRLMGCVVNAHYATVVAPMSQEEYDAAMAEFERSMGKTCQELKEYAGETLVNDYIYNQVFAKVAYSFAETLLED